MTKTEIADLLEALASAQQLAAKITDCIHDHERRLRTLESITYGASRTNKPELPPAPQPTPPPKPA